MDILEMLLLITIACCYVFFLVTLQKSLKTISTYNRNMEPAAVWILIVPFLGTVFMFFVADAIATGFKREFEQRGVFTQANPTYAMGLTMATLQCGYFLATFFTGATLFIMLFGFAIPVIWILYWVQVNQKRKELLNLKRNRNLEPGETSIFV